MKKRFFSLLMFCPLTAFAMTPLNSDIAVGMIHDDNITNGNYDNDVLDDHILNLNGNIAYTQILNRKSNLVYSAQLHYYHYQDYDKLNNTRLTLKASYHLQPEISFGAPWYFASFSFGIAEYDSNLRDDNSYQLDLGMGKRLTDRMKLRTAFQVISHDADNSIFDADTIRVYANLDVILNQDNTLYTTLSYSDGDIVSIDSEPYSPYGNTRYTSDDAFPDLVNPRAYRVEAKVMALSIGDNLTLTPQQAIDFSLTYYDADADYRQSYDRLRFNLYYLYRF